MSSLAAPIRPTAAHQWFEQRLPELVSRCQAFMRCVPRAEREEAQAEVLAQSFRYVVGAEQRGKLHRLTPFTLVSFFGRSYRAGCLMTGSHPKDVLSQAARIKNGHKIFSLQTPDPAALRKQQQVQASLADTLADRKADRPLENVRRDLDYSDILDREAANRKVRRVFHFFCETAGQGPQIELARELGVSPPRVCQLKAQLADMLAAHDYEPPATRRERPSPSRRGRSTARHSRRREIPLNAGTNPITSTGDPP
jgi:hypothetical protein